MYALARRMADAGRRVVCTTTTKIFPAGGWPSRGSLGRRGDPVAAVHDALSAVPCVVAAGVPLPDVRKLDGVSPACLAVLSAALPEALFLVAGPTARPGKPPQGHPSAHEPVLPEPLGCCVAVVGLDSVGSRWTTGMCTVPHWFARRRAGAGFSR